MAAHVALVLSGSDPLISELFLHGSAEEPKVLPERVGRAGCSALQVLLEKELIAEGSAFADGVRLRALPSRDLGRAQVLAQSQAHSGEGRSEGRRIEPALTAPAACAARATPAPPRS